MVLSIYENSRPELVRNAQQGREHVKERQSSSPSSSSSPQSSQSWPRSVSASVRGSAFSHRARKTTRMMKKIAATLKRAIQKNFSTGLSYRQVENAVLNSRLVYTFFMVLSIPCGIYLDVAIFYLFLVNTPKLR